MDKKASILAIRLSAMGDVAMCVPVIRALTAQHPEVRLTMVSRPFLKPLFDGIPNVSFFGADVDTDFKGPFGIYRLYHTLKRQHFAYLADLHNVLRTQLLRNFMRFSVSKSAVIDKGRAEKKALTRPDNKIFKPLRSTHQRYADVFRKLGFDLDMSRPYFSPKKQLSEQALKLIGKTPKIRIGIAPFAQYTSKIFPLDLMEKVVAQLSRLPDTRILLFGGGASEVQQLEKLAEKYENTLSLAGKIRLEKELEVISNLDVMLSMDSANAHLAAMFGVKTITLWGATHPYTGFAPYGQPEEFCLTPDLSKYPKLPCSVYGNKVCAGYEDVMRSIPPEKVVETVKEVIKKAV